MGVKKNKELFATLMTNFGALTEKHKIKLVGIWIDPPGHTVYALHETDSMDNLTDLLMEPDVLSTLTFQTIETKPLLPYKDAMALLK